MNEETNQFQKGLLYISNSRKTHMTNSKYIILLFIISAIISALFPPAIVINVLLTAFYFYSYYKTARVKCPRCGKPFGTSSILPLGIGTSNCENCNLSLELTKTNANSHSKEWLE